MRCVLLLAATVLLLGACGSPTLALPTPTRAPAVVRRATPARDTRQFLSRPAQIASFPAQIYRVSIGVHPVNGWPAVGMMTRFGESDTPIQVYARVFDPQGQAWGPTLQLDTGDSSCGMDANGTVVVGVLADRTVVAVWGNDGSRDGGIWSSETRDYGRTWSTPTRIATGGNIVLSIATDDAGRAVALATGYLRSGDTVLARTLLMTRSGPGVWDVTLLAVPAIDGAVALADGRAVALVATKRDDAIVAVTRDLTGGSWQAQTIRVDGALDAPGDERADGFFWHVNAVAFTRQLPDDTLQDGALFTWTRRDRGDVYALLTRDAGRSWGPIRRIVQDLPGRTVRYAAPGYDASADRAIALWTCCDDANPTHYASWGTLGGAWRELSGPIISGAARAGWTSSAQPPASRAIWLVWVENDSQVMVRTLETNALVPVGQYPAATPEPTEAPVWEIVP